MRAAKPAPEVGRLIVAPQNRPSTPGHSRVRRGIAAFAHIVHAEVNGLHLALRRAGSGPPVLLLHGIPTSSRLWDGVGARLADGHDVIAPDLLGFGDSDKPLNRDVSITAQAELIVGLLDALGVERATVVGHDIGGGVAQIMAVHEPDRVAALGLIDSVSFDSWPIPPMRALAASKPVISRLPAGWVISALERVIGNEVPDHGREPLSQAISAWGTGPETLEAFLRNVEALDSRHTEEVAPRLGELSMPVQIVWGAADSFQKTEWAPRLRDAIPGATLKMLDSRHFVPWERPEEVAEEIAELAARAA